MGIKYALWSKERYQLDTNPIEVGSNIRTVDGSTKQVTALTLYLVMY